MRVIGAIFCLLSITLAPPFAMAGDLQNAASQTAECVQQVCLQSAPIMSVSDFTNIEKVKHPDLDSFIAAYMDRVEAIRVGRQKQALVSIAALNDKIKIENEVNAMNGPQLISSLTDLRLLEPVSQIQNGLYSVVANPHLRQDKSDQSKLIVDLFERIKKISPLYVAYLKVNYLNIEPHVALGIKSDVPILPHVLSKIRIEAQSLPQNLKSQFEGQLTKLLSQMPQLTKKYGEKINIFPAGFERDISVGTNKINLSDSESILLKKIVSEKFAVTLSDRANAIENLDKVFDKSTWDKTCSKAYNRALHYASSKEEVIGLTRMKEDALRRTKNSLEELFGNPLAEKVFAYVSTMNIGGPTTLDDYRENLESQLKIYENLVAKPRLTLIEMQQLVNNLDTQGDHSLRDDLCNSWVFEPVRDSANGKYIILSSYSAKNYNIGLSVAAHELGHAASFALKVLAENGENVQRFESIRECISENYLSSNRKNSDLELFAKDKLWTEEDWADALSGYSLRDLTVDNGCAFLGMNLQDDFLNLASRSTDPHSPTFYRILNIYSHLGKNLSPQCTAAVESEFPGTKFRKCLVK